MLLWLWNVFSSFCFLSAKGIFSGLQYKNAVLDLISGAHKSYICGNGTKVFITVVGYRKYHRNKTSFDNIATQVPVGGP